MSDYMRVVGVSPDGNRYMVSLEADWQAALKTVRPLARVFMMDTRELSPPLNALTVLSQQVWQPAEIAVDRLQELLADATVYDEPMAATVREELARRAREAPARAAS